MHGEGPDDDVDGDGQEPDEDDEQEEGRVVVGVLRPDDDRVDADEGLDHRQDDQQRRQDLQVLPLGTQVQKPVVKHMRFTVSAFRNSVVISSSLV